jgi:diaminohydroxyphosphoribosylaminopyrimidine deaminase/5-amino-6-(5-phosphoribosylamino)uracil reductase
MDEAGALRRAVELAWRGWGRAQPNPLVGAVVLRDGNVVGEGWHAEFGGPHAEREALDATRGEVAGATLAVNLEPCAHQGKQPPCAPMLVAAGVRRVVYAMRDPNPLAAGGAELLARAGVSVERLPAFEAEAAAQNAPFLHGHSHPERPWVALKLATSLDGRIADSAGRSRWISGPEAREWAHWLRAGFDALAVGAETARRDDPALTVRGSVRPRREPTRVVFVRESSLPTGLKLFSGSGEAPTLVVRVGGGSATRESRFATEGVLAADLSGALLALRERGLGTVLVEGGGRLAGSLLAAGLVDRLYWVQSPLWLGDAGVPAVKGLPAVDLGAADRWQVVERRALGQDTLLVADRTCSLAS